MSQVLSEQTSDSSAFLNAAMYLLKCLLNCEQHFSYFDLDYETSGLTNRISEGLLYNSWALPLRQPAR
jgi:hypothetical protein